jgi:hypothetical protein
MRTRLFLGQPLFLCVGALKQAANPGKSSMPTSYSPAQIEHFKREAKSLGHANSLIHSQALDQIAADHGWRNWSLLMKHGQSLKEGTQPWHRFDRTLEEMKLALRVVQPSSDDKRPRSEVALSLVEDINGKFTSARNAVSFAIQYMESLLAMPRYRVAWACVVQSEMRCWLPYCAIAGAGSYILVNRRYKPVGATTKDHVDYGNFSHLTLRLIDDQLLALAHGERAPGYLFEDGCPPWESRKDAEAYMARLKTLKLALES